MQDISVSCKNCGGDTQVVGQDEDSVKIKCKCCGSVFLEPKLIAQKSVSKLENKNGKKVFDDCSKGVLEITVGDSECIFSGSGFVFREDGYAITNRHVVSNEGKVFQSGVAVIDHQKYTFKTICVASQIDIAIIKINENVLFNELQFGNSDQIANGETIYIIGNPKGLGTSITCGIISDKCRNVGGDKLILTDAAVNGGNSGGPMFNEQGEVIGVVVASYIEAEGMNLAIPINLVKDYINENC